jgi:hypothetical protein
MQGRLLILSAYPDVGHPSELTREKCMMMNAWCEQIAEISGVNGRKFSLTEIEPTVKVAGISETRCDLRQRML